jgi:hypothetical protein
MVGGGGGTRECTSPLQHVTKSQKRDTLPASCHFSDVTTTENHNQVLSRKTDLWGGRVIGGGSSAAAYIDVCKGLADELYRKHPGMLKPPYKAAVGGDCEVQIWPTRKRPSYCYSSCVTHRMIDNARACADKTNKIIGFIEDYSTDMFGYHMFMGTFCGR